MIINELQNLRDEFLERWTPLAIENLTLEEYVGVGNKDTFCQWVETKTRMLGSIKGMTSIKFGIYERKDKNKFPKKYKNDERYSWLSSYGDDPKTAFERAQKDLCKIIYLSELGKFSEIDDIKLPDLFKWKIAFLYSNERLIPIFKREVLFKIAQHFGLKTNRRTRISEIQNIMILHKPVHLNVYQYMWELFEKFGNNKDKKEIESKIKKRRIKRRAATERNTEPQKRTVIRSYIAEQKHNKIQKALVKMLTAKYGSDCIKLEENYVDVKLIEREYITFFEVKSSSFASECVKEALGQLLLYSLNDTDKRLKKHVVVGQYPVNENDLQYIDFLKRNLRLEFDYLNVEID